VTNKYLQKIKQLLGPRNSSWAPESQWRVVAVVEIVSVEDNELDAHRTGVA
jgi:hypothetical protein